MYITPSEAFSQLTSHVRRLAAIVERQQDRITELEQQLSAVTTSNISMFKQLRETVMATEILGGHVSELEQSQRRSFEDQLKKNINKAWGWED